MSLLIRMRERLGTAELMLVGISIVAWAFLLLAAWPMTMQPVHVAASSSYLELAQSAVMVVAMMAPALAGPYLHLWFRSLSRHRWRALTLFTFAYVSVWTVAAVLLSKAAALLLAARSGASTAILVAAALLAWQLSPIRAHCLARCHLRPRISVFGPAAVIDPLRFGTTIALWCVASCWALMEIAHLWPEAQLPLLAVATIIIAVERLTDRRHSSLPGSRPFKVRLGDYWWSARSLFARGSPLGFLTSSRGGHTAIRDARLPRQFLIVSSCSDGASDL